MTDLGQGQQSQGSMQLIQQLEQVIFGQETAIRQVVIALLAGGHVLLEGVPGLGKTRLAKALAQFVEGEYHRIQFTPDLMPSDILGNAVFDVQGSTFQVHKGPIFTNVLLADEINRTPPKTQAALLEAMEEDQVSIYGSTYELPNPFFVIATQNPIEYEGTYPLPEAQLDRFLMMVSVGYPDEEAERQMLTEHRQGYQGELQDFQPVMNAEQLAREIHQASQVKAAAEIVDYVMRIIRFSRGLEGVILGASPRAGTALLDAAKAVAYLEGRNYTIPDDVVEVAAPVLRHRILLDANAEVEGVRSDDIVATILQQVAAPR